VQQVQQVQQLTIDLYDSLLRVMQERCTCCTESRSRATDVWAAGRSRELIDQAERDTTAGGQSLRGSSPGRSMPSPATHNVRPPASKAVTPKPGGDAPWGCPQNRPTLMRTKRLNPHHLLGRGCIPAPMVYRDTGRRYGQGPSED